MSRAPSPGMPNDIGMADHFRAIADRFQSFENSPAFTDPNNTTKLNKLDDVTNVINNLQETLTQSLRQAVNDEMKSVKDDLKSVKDDLKSVKDDLKSVKDDLKSVKDDLKSVKDDLKSTKDDLKSTKDDLKSVKDDLTTQINTVKNDLTTQINTVKNDLTTKIDIVKEELKSTKDDLKSVKDDLTTQINTVKEDLATKIDTVKEDLTTKINALETSLKINIATRDINSIVRPRNASNDKITPLFSVYTGAPIERFPSTRHQVETLSHPQTVRILGELGDLLYDPESGAAAAAKDRLLVLVGIQAHSRFPTNNAVANV